MNRSNSSEQHKECAAVDVSDSKLNRQAALVREPFLLKPTGKDYLWGGSRLNDDFSKGIDMQPLAETWECSTHPDGPSTIASGTFEHPQCASHHENSDRRRRIARQLRVILFCAAHKPATGPSRA